MYGNLIETVTVGSGGTTSINFTSIAQVPYTDLILVISAITGGSDGTVKMTFNGSSSTYTNRLLYGVPGSTSGSQTNSLLIVAKAGLSSNNPGNSMVVIPNYVDSYAKSMTANISSQNFQAISAGGWDGTSAITSISLTTPNDVAGFSQYTTVSLYGLTKGSGGATVS